MGPAGCADAGYGLTARDNGWTVRGLTRFTQHMIEIVEEDPTAPEVVALIEAHREFSLSITPAEHAYAMPPEAVASGGLTMVGAREDGALLGVGALREFDASTGEVKSECALRSTQYALPRNIWAAAGAATRAGLERLISPPTYW